MSPNADYLFDRGFISFRDDGGLLRSAAVDPELFRRLGVSLEPGANCGTFTKRQRGYLRKHRRRIFLGDEEG